MYSYFYLTPRTVIAPLVEVYGGKAAYSNFWGGMDEEASVKKMLNMICSMGLIRVVAILAIDNRFPQASS